MPKIMKCPMCGKIHSIEIFTEKETTIVNDEEVTYDAIIYFCENSDEDEAYFVPSSVLNENLKRARKAYEQMIRERNKTNENT